MDAIFDEPFWILIFLPKIRHQRSENPRVPEKLNRFSISLSFVYSLSDSEMRSWQSSAGTVYSCSILASVMQDTPIKLQLALRVSLPCLLPCLEGYCNEGRVSLY